MVITLIDVIVSTYMYSIHSLFIAIDKVKSYSKVLFISSIVSILCTVLLLKTTNLGVYAIAATSTVILGITHAIIVPAIIAKLLDKKIHIFWISELKSWGTLAILCIIFFGIRNVLTITSWFDFFKNVAWIGIVGYIVSLLLIFNSNEKKEFYKWMVTKKNKIYKKSKYFKN